MRRFLFLQGPHGPFFGQLADALTAAGASVERVAFNAGDAAFWGRRDGLIPYRGDDWAGAVGPLLEARGITDLVCYGAERARHAVAVAAARRSGVRTHLLEEGYLRPWWITYERDGTNAASPARDFDPAALVARGTPQEGPAPPSGWGEIRQHVAWGALYHAALLAGRRTWPLYDSHRDDPVSAEFRRYAGRLLTMPRRRVRRRIATARLLRSGAPFHLLLLQLGHDASFRAGPFPDQRSVLEAVVAGFADGASPRHRLVVKAHPLEDGRERLSDALAEVAARHRVAGRVLLIDGGKLAPLLRAATSAVTVTSTAGQQVLWHGLPLLCLGAAVYDHPALVSRQDPASFFARPAPPDRSAYLAFRQALLDTSQVPGGFYAVAGRRRLLRRLPDLMLAARDRYAETGLSPAAGSQHLRLLGD